MTLSFHQTEDLEQYLKEKHWLPETQSIVRLEKPGEGNMNFTMRVYTDTNETFIIKQSRAYVEKYPFIPAPKDRVIREGKFYQLTSQISALATFMPRLIAMDEANQIILTEDLGISSDLSYLYNKQVLKAEEISNIIEFLNLLHHRFVSDTPLSTFENREMRLLNHEHIFIYPFLDENGLNLEQITPGLQAFADTFKQKEALKQEAKKLGEIYLAEGNYLLHGDYYFGSFLKTSNGIKVIDPEFCFYGRAEFDLGVLFAHLKLANQSEEILQIARKAYQTPKDFDEKLFQRFVGIEIIRRLIGLAQLPLNLTLEQKMSLLLEAEQLLLTKSI